MDITIKIPERFIEKLSTDRGWLRTVEIVTNNILDYTLISPYFFPEYTNHGIKHIQKVLDISSRIITDSSLAVMSCKEIGITIISICIHDIGMFITKDGLKKIIYGEFNNTKIDLLDNYTWKQTWENYMYSVLRMSDKRLIRIFGSDEPIQWPSDDMENLSERDILLYGNFLREIHGRLGHVISVQGFLGMKNLDIFFGTDLNTSTKDLIGLIVRSHCIPLRDTREYLTANFTEASYPKNIRIFYIMSILRISDYLDAGYDRASHVISCMQTKKSVNSIEEYSWNQVIDYDDYDWKSRPETLCIDAYPKNSNQFLKIEEWLNNIQRELDMSWAVLGEFYGGKEETSLSIRRISSNILKKETRKNFESRFVTRKATLDTNPDILKLLIYPLYDDNPKYGIRELLQNAVDACNERKILSENRNISYNPLINLWIDTKKSTVTIQDNGIGMDADIIINYYLVSGASFRNSDLWNKHFMKDKMSTISRTGKFGIGALATFLIGERAAISTKKINWDGAVSSNLGYRFELEVSHENISIERVDTETGTTIIIYSNPDTISCIIENEKYPIWTDWFCFDIPHVHYYLDGKEKIHSEDFVPDEKEIFNGWHTLNTINFHSYKWSYKHRIIDDINSYCNGIPITNPTIINGESYGFDISNPVISLVDYDNNAKYNLARNQLTEFPCEAEFISEGYKYVIARLLILNDIKNREDFFCLIENGFVLGKKYGYEKTPEIFPSAFLVSSTGYTLMSPTFLYKANVKRLKVIFIKSGYLNKLNNISTTEPVYFCQIGTRKRRSFFLKSFNNIFFNNKIKGVKETAINFEVNRIFFDSELIELFEKENFLSSLNLRNSSEYFYNFAVDFGNGFKDIPMVTQTLDFYNSSKILAIMTYDICYDDFVSNNMLDTLNYYLTSEWIPYNMKQRKTLFNKAWSELGEYMAD